MLREPPPEQGSDPQALLSPLEREVFSPIGNLLHPRFFRFIPSPSNWVSVLAELLASGYNPFAGNWMEASGPAAIEMITLCMINPRTTEQDVRGTLERLAAHGRRLSAQWSGPP